GSPSRGGWKEIDFTVLLQGAARYSIQIPDNLRSYAPWEGNSSAYLFDRWHREDPFDSNSAWIPGKYPSARQSNLNPMGNSAQETDRNTIDASYLRVKSVEVGYTLPRKATHFLGLQHLRCYVNAYNLFTFCDRYLKNDLKLDPEKTAGQDSRMMNYPLSTTVSLGVNVIF
ncbi:MAG: TonB-dependent receptor, partial [Bacteroides sp.]|nr:TonB-dependent receptor [Bacteroides sp.]